MRSVAVVNNIVMVMALVLVLVLAVVACGPAADTPSTSTHVTPPTDDSSTTAG